MTTLLHPEVWSHLPSEEHIKDALLRRALDCREAQELSNAVEPNVTVVVRALNEARALEGLLIDIATQDYSGEIETIVVDNESTDGTREVARAFGAEVVRIARDAFSHPKALNKGTEAASHNIIYSTVAHANLSTDQLLRSGTRPFVDNLNVSGVYSRRYLPGNAATIFERINGLLVHQVFAESGLNRQLRLGTLSTVSALFAKPVWEDIGRFDPQYVSGGEDADMARRMIEAGHDLYQEPVTTVHHSHGIGVIDGVRQGIGYVRTLRSPGEDTINEVRRRRPHLDFT